MRGKLGSLSKPLTHAVITVVFTLVIGNLLALQSDWTIHVMFAAQLLRGELAAVHIGFHIAVIALSGGQIGWMWLGAWVVGVASVNLTFDVLYRWFHGSMWLALAAFVAAPILVFTPENQYFGYIGFHSLHSPTMTMLKPLAFLLFVAILRWLEHQRGGLVVVMLCLVSAFVKPNMALILLPALVVVGGWQVWRMRHIDRAVVVSGVVLAGILAFQYVAQYALIDGQDGGMIVAPLQSMMQYEPDVLALIGKGLLSAAFPISVAVVYGMRQSMALQFAWLIFLFGVAEMYLMAETGARAEDGNFWWGAQIGLFILFAVSLRHFMQYKRAAGPWKAYAVRMILALHIASGATFLLLRTIIPGQEAMW